MKAFGQSVQAIGQQMVGVGVAAGLPLGFAAKRFADFDDAMRATKGTTRATEAEFQSLTDLARKLGRETSFTAIEVANLMLNLGRAGFNPSQIEGMTAAVMDLARATGTDAALAAKIVGTSLRQFKLDAKDAARVADTLTSAANNSNNTVETLGDALSYAGPVAKQFGYSIEETAAIIGTLANSGIEASAAGTSIRRLLTITGAESEKLKEIFKVDFKDMNGNARNLIDVLGEVAQSTSKMGSAARAEKFNEAFGLLGITGANVIGSSVADTKKLFETIKAAGGIARETAKQMDSGLGGAIRITLSAMDDAVMGIGEHLAPALMLMGTALQDGSKAFRKWADENKLAIAIVGTAVVATVALGAALVGVGIALKVAAFALGTFTALAGSVRLVSAAVMGVVTTVRVLNAALVAALSVAKLTSLALAGVGAVVLVLKAGVLALFAPLTLIVGAIGGVGYAFVGASKEGEKARAALGTSFEGIREAAVSAWGGISDAIKAGDTSMAFEILAKGLNVVWLNALAGMKTAWAEMVGFLQISFFKLGGSIVTVWANILAGFKSMYNEIRTGMENIFDLPTLTKIRDLKDKIGTDKKRLQDRIDANPQKDENLLGQEERDKRAFIRARIQDAQKELDAIQGNRDKEQEQRRAEIGRELLGKEEDVKGKVKAFEDEVRNKPNPQLEKLLQELQQAKADLNKLNGGAAEARLGKELGDKQVAGGAAIGGLGLFGVQLAKAKDAIAPAAEKAGLGGLVGGKGGGGREGTFSAAAAMVSFNGTSGVATQQLNVMKQLLEEQRKNNNIGNKQLQALKDAGIILE